MHKEMELEDRAKEEKKIKIKRFFLSLLSIFIIIIFIMYMLMAYDLQNIIAGLLASTTLRDDLSMTYKEYTITLSTDVYHDLRHLYFANLQHEFKACLAGTQQEHHYTITSLSVPFIISQSVFQVVSSACKENTLIDLHSHPYKHCAFSDQDINSYRAMKKNDPDILLGLMCEPDRFTFYRE